jgi:uncharacterized protein DUF1990
MHGPGEEQASALSPATAGAGPLLQRDYWGVVARCRVSPSALVKLVVDRFESFSPPELAAFERPGEDCRLELEDELTVRIAGAGLARVRVVHRDAQSFTLATLAGHPEAGRITFGAYRNGRGDVIFHIRSRARSGSFFHRAGFVGIGEAMQTNTWTDFVNRVAAVAGAGVVGVVHAETNECADEPEDVARSAPTFLARGD